MPWSGVVALVLLILGRGGSAEELRCRDHNGNGVDWYVLSKLPKDSSSTIPHVSDGLGYTHYSSASSGGKWALSDIPISDRRSHPGRTLAPVYDNPQRSSLIYIFYNDAHPDGSTSSVRGHTKGVVAFDGNIGFWMVHSVPKYPSSPGQQYSYPGSGTIYGQSFLCLTLQASLVEEVAKQLLSNEVYAYSASISPSLEARYPLMTKLIKESWSSDLTEVSVKQMETPGGHQFVTFAKGRKFDKDLYSDFLAPYLQTSLFTETWARPRLNSCGRRYQVNNVREVSVTATRTLSDDVTFSFTNTRDHSKWAVSANATKPWVCIGDINRMASQARRGGGTVCHSNDALWRMYRGMVRDYDPCP